MIWALLAIVNAVLVGIGMGLGAWGPVALNFTALAICAACAWSTWVEADRLRSQK